MKRYKTQHDIPYLKFMEFSELIKDRATDLEFIAETTINIFYPGETENLVLRLEEFSMALKENPKRICWYWINLSQFKKTSNFIDADTFSNEKDYSSLLKMIIKPFNVNKVSLSDGNKIMRSFLFELPKLSNLFNIFLIRQIRLQLQR